MFEGFAIDGAGTLHTSAHGRGVKVWYDDATRKHYEAQLVRVEGTPHRHQPGPRCRDHPDNPPDEETSTEGR